MGRPDGCIGFASMSRTAGRRPAGESLARRVGERLTVSGVAPMLTARRTGCGGVLFFIEGGRNESIANRKSSLPRGLGSDGRGVAMS